MDKIFKSFQLKLDAESLKGLDQGKLSIVFATMGVVDKDGDVAVPGFYGNQDIVMVPAHDWSHVPIGKGVTREDGDSAIADIQMNLDIQAAKDWLSAIKFDMQHGKPLQEYSYGFKVLDGGSKRGDYNGQQVRYLQPREDGTPGSKIWEVSPVLVGAGQDTRTLSAKSAGTKFCDEAQAVLDAVDALSGRVGALAAMRGKEGREISAPNKEKLAAIAASLEMVAKDMVGLIAPAAVTQSPSESDAKKQLARMLRIRAGIK